MLHETHRWAQLFLTLESPDSLANFSMSLVKGLAQGAGMDPDAFLCKSDSGI